MKRKNFPKAGKYVKALCVMREEGIPENHLEILRSHLKAKNHTATWEQLAKAVGYKRGAAINLHYGRLAHRIADQLGKHLPPEGFWLKEIVDWAKERGPKGHTAFVLKRPVIQAIKKVELLAPPVKRKSPNRTARL